jgi:uncharacterized membrane protein YebE (DUF533 family)
MAMTPLFFATLTVTKPVAVGIGIGALVALYLAFKVGKFIIKMLLLLAVLLAIGLAAWWYHNAHHGSL